MEVITNHPPQKSNQKKGRLVRGSTKNVEAFKEYIAKTKPDQDTQSLKIDTTSKGDVTGSNSPNKTPFKQ